MPTFRVRDGETIGHDGKTRTAGEILELPRSVAEDTAVRGAIEEVDADGNVVTPPPPDDLARFRSHERVSMLRQRLIDAQAVVDQLQARLKDEERRLADDVAAAAAAAPPASGGKRPSTKDSASSAAAPVNPAS